MLTYLMIPHLCSLLSLANEVCINLIFFYNYLFFLLLLYSDLLLFISTYDGKFHMSTRMGHKMPRYLAKAYSRYYSKGVWIRLKFKSIVPVKQIAYPNVSGYDAIS